MTAYQPPNPRRLPEPERKQRFDVTGQVLRARVLLGERETKLAELAIEGDVRLVETQTAKPGERPVLLRGDQLHLIDPETPRAAATIVGRDAAFEGRGMTVLAPRINLNRGTNRLTIDGAGRMKLPVENDLEGRPLDRPSEMWINWHDRMVFDGRTARFEDSVVASTDQQRLLTDMLEVQFRRPIQFQQTDPGDEPDIEQILCRGGVRMLSRVEQAGKPQSWERFEVSDLTVNLTSGQVSGTGPGWLMSVRPDTDQMPGVGAMPLTPGAAASPRAETAPGATSDQLRQLYVRFQTNLTGNVHQRKMTFHGNVRTIYTPVDDWEPPIPSSDPAELGPKSLVMTCDHLTVAQSPGAAPRASAIEMEAAGNTLVESSQYTARAVRLTYTEAKDLLVLEGDGRTDAQLYRQQTVGGPTSKATAQRILFWPSSNRLKVDGARSLELSQFGSPDRPAW